MAHYMILESTVDPVTQAIIHQKILHEKKETDEGYENRKTNLVVARDMLKSKIPRGYGRRYREQYYYKLDSRDDPQGNHLELGAHLIPEMFTQYAVDYSDLDTGY